MTPKRLFFVFLYLLIGWIYFGSFDAWKKKHCDGPELYLTDGAVIATMWAPLIPAVIFTGLINPPAKVCTK